MKGSLDNLTREELTKLLYKANERRKRETRGLRRQLNHLLNGVSGLSEFIREKDRELEMYRCREADLKRRENYVNQWAKGLDDLVKQENEKFKDLFTIQKCTECNRRKRYNKMKPAFMKLINCYLNTIDDMMAKGRETLPDNIKAILIDMRLAALETRAQLQELDNGKEEKKQ